MFCSNCGKQISDNTKFCATIAEHNRIYPMQIPLLHNSKT